MTCWISWLSICYSCHSLPLLLSLEWKLVRRSPEGGSEGTTSEGHSTVSAAILHKTGSQEHRMWLKVCDSWRNCDFSLSVFHPIISLHCPMLPVLCQQFSSSVKFAIAWVLEDIYYPLSTILPSPPKPIFYVRGPVNSLLKASTLSSNFRILRTSKFKSNFRKFLWCLNHLSSKLGLLISILIDNN